MQLLYAVAAGVRAYQNGFSFYNLIYLMDNVALNIAMQYN